MTRFLEIVFTLLLLNISKYSAEKSGSTMIKCQLDAGGMVESPRRWPGGIVPYAISNGFSENEKDTIQIAIDDWNFQIPEVQFVPRNDSHEDYVLFDDSFKWGCSSPVGVKGGVQRLELYPDMGCVQRSVIQHEMMHASGFHHEHSRPDRDNFVKVLWDNIRYGYRSSFKMYNSAVMTPANEYGPYDYYSIVHYPTIFSGTTVMEVLKEGVDIGIINNDLKNISSLDKMKLKKFYEDDSTIIKCQSDGSNMVKSPRRWPGGIVPYDIFGRFFEHEKDTIQKAVDDWNLQIPEVQFVPRNDSHKDFVSFTYTSSGCHSPVGNVGGRQGISLSRRHGCVRRSAIHHEMMHAIGFQHEHTRPNRDEFVKILLENIPFYIPLNTFRKYDSAVTTPANEFGPYDYYSIVHSETIVKGKTIMKVLKEGVDIGKINDDSKNISSIDKMKLKKFYEAEK